MCVHVCECVCVCICVFMYVCHVHVQAEWHTSMKKSALLMWQEVGGASPHPSLSYLIGPSDQPAYVGC